MVQLFRPFCFCHRLQYGYDLLREGTVRLHDPPEKPFHAEQKDLELLAKFLTLNDLDESSIQTAV